MKIQKSFDGEWFATMTVPADIGGSCMAADFGRHTVEAYLKRETTGKFGICDSAKGKRIKATCLPTGDYVVTVPLEEAKEETPATTREEKIQYLKKSGFVAKTRKSQYVWYIHRFNAKRQFLKGKGMVDVVESEKFETAPDGGKDRLSTKEIFFEQWSELTDQVIDDFYQQVIEAQKRAGVIK